MSIRTSTLAGYAALSVFLISLFAPPSISAQSQATTGTIEGIVTDSTGAVLPGVAVTLSNAGTGFQRELTTDEGGRYRGLALPLGTYRIEAKLAGFGGVVRDDVPLAVGQALRIDLRMSPAGVTEQVRVTAGSPVV
jgi:hypothetical protein